MFIFRFVYEAMGQYEASPAEQRNPRVKDGLLYMLQCIGADLIKVRGFQSRLFFFFFFF